jgi:hypothetical protein
MKALLQMLQCSHSIAPQAPKHSTDPPLIKHQMLSQPWRKKNKNHHLQATKHHKNKKHNKCRTMAPSTSHGDQLSLVLALSIIPKCSNPSSIGHTFIQPSFRLCSH